MTQISRIDLVGNRRNLWNLWMYPHLKGLTLELDLSSLQEAIHALGETLARANDEKLMGSLDEVTQYAIRAGAILDFEFTYELSWKFIQRWLRLNASPADAEPLTRRELFRTAADYGLIANPQPWFKYSEARNLTSHTYDRVVADKVFDAAALFLEDGRYLLEQLELRNDPSGRDATDAG